MTCDQCVHFGMYTEADGFQHWGGSIRHRDGSLTTRGYCAVFLEWFWDVNDACKWHAQRPGQKEENGGRT